MFVSGVDAYVELGIMEKRVGMIGVLLFENGDKRLFEWQEYHVLLTDEFLIINSVSIIIVSKDVGFVLLRICLIRSSAAFCPISNPGCLTVVIDGVTSSLKGSLLKPTIAISSGTFIPVLFK